MGCTPMKLNDRTYHLGKVDDDRDLLVKLSKGQERAFAAIYNKYWRMVYQAAEKFLQSPNLAQDVVQEVFSTIWIQRQEFTEVENLEAYLRTMAKNRIYSELRAWSKEKRNLEGYLIQAETSVDDSDFSILDSQNERLLEEILSLLPPRQQEVFNLARKEGLSHEKIAERLHVSNGTVKNHMVRALQTIRMHLAPHMNSHMVWLTTFFII
jgi:RNA polymerase sigma-70 factor (family 1)